MNPMNPNNVRKNLSGLYDIIFETPAGSYLYGTAIGGKSDIDYRGVTMEPQSSIIGLSSFEQYEYKDNGEDIIIYGLRKFINLALGQNPNITELLFAPLIYPYPKGIVNPIYTNVWEEIVNHRKYFLSRKISDTFVGYAVSQLKRMETHYKWMKEKPPKKPFPPEFGAYTESDGFGNIKYHFRSIEKENEYKNVEIHFKQYHTWLENRNKDRHDLEEKYGYDTKNAMHLIRLLQQGQELLETGFLTLPRPNADELLSIRNGALKYHQILAYMDMKKKELNDLAQTSILPDKPNYEIIDKLTQHLNYDYLKNLRE